MPKVNCKICNSPFYAKPRHLKIGCGKYCSKKCQNTSQRTGFWTECNNCGKSIWKTPRDVRDSKSGKFFCSKSCQTVWRNKHYSETKHPMWKNGINTYRNILLRSKVPVMCLKCKLKDKRILIVHHLDKNRTNNSLGNLVWLCANCHMLIHADNKEMKSFLKNI